jgi:carbamoyl-phosphate synthase large subunit
MNILITTAGGGNALNLARSLKKGFGGDLRIVGVNIDRFELAKAYHDPNYDRVALVKPFKDPEYVTGMLRLIDEERINFVILNHEFEVEYVREQARDNPQFELLLDYCFLPSLETTKLCNNKYNMNRFLDGFENVDKKLGINGKSAIPDSSTLSYPLSQYKKYPYWVRLKTGAGSRGANLIHNMEELHSWTQHWIDKEGVSSKDFMISEYLPKDDYHYFSLWNNGEMVIGKAIKRIRYCCAKYSVTGTSSSPSLCVLIKSQNLDTIAQNIIKAIDPDAQGLFGIDFKGDVDNNPKITEINIGRFPRINYIFNLTPGGNIAKRFVEIGMNAINVGKSTDSQYPSYKYFLVRDFDTEPVLITNQELAGMEIYI